LDNPCFILMEKIKDPYISAQPGERGHPSDFEILNFDDVGAVSLRAVNHDPVLVGRRRFFLPHSSSSSRFTAGAEFFILSQSGERPER
jgi:hypothetical protein